MNKVYHGSKCVYFIYPSVIRNRWRALPPTCEEDAATRLALGPEKLVGLFAILGLGFVLAVNLFLGEHAVAVYKDGQPETLILGRKKNRMARSRTEIALSAQRRFALVNEGGGDRSELVAYLQELTKIAKQMEHT